MRRHGQRRESTARSTSSGAVNIRAQSVKVIDDTIEYLQGVREKLLAGEIDVPPPAQPERIPMASPTTPPVDTKPRKRRTYVKKDYPPRTCEQCGTEFVPEHHKSKLCSDECRERRAMNRKNGINMTFKRVELKPDADEGQLEKQKQALAEKFAGSHTRHQQGSNLQSAPRAKFRGRLDREPRKCISCGDEFLPATYKSGYCSKTACKRAMQTQHMRNMRAEERREIQAGIEAIRVSSESKPYAEYRQSARRPLKHEVPPPPSEVPVGSPEAAAAIERVKAAARQEAAEGRKILVPN